MKLVSHGWSSAAFHLDRRNSARTLSWGSSDVDPADSKAGFIVLDQTRGKQKMLVIPDTWDPTSNQIDAFVSRVCDSDKYMEDYIRKIGREGSTQETDMRVTYFVAVVGALHLQFQYEIAEQWVDDLPEWFFYFQSNQKLPDGRCARHIGLSIDHEGEFSVSIQDDCGLEYLDFPDAPDTTTVARLLAILLENGTKTIEPR